MSPGPCSGSVQCWYWMMQNIMLDKLVWEFCQSDHSLLSNKVFCEKVLSEISPGQRFGAVHRWYQMMQKIILKNVVQEFCPQDDLLLLYEVFSLKSFPGISCETCYGLACRWYQVMQNIVLDKLVQEFCRLDRSLYQILWRIPPKGGGGIPWVSQRQLAARPLKIWAPNIWTNTGES